MEKISRLFNFQLQVTVFRLKKEHLACHIQVELTVMPGFSFADHLPAQNLNKFRPKISGAGASPSPRDGNAGHHSVYTIHICRVLCIQPDYMMNT
jgi:hypothetical protein